jgi:uncharacterized protein (TIGR02680 family)
MSLATVTEMPTTPTMFEGRARWRRAGIINVHRYSNAEFSWEGGRLIFRGANGSGKSKAMDMLFPFLLSGDRRRMGSGTSGPVTVESLMKVGLNGATNRVGYVWAECQKPDGTYLTVGAFFRWAQNAADVTVAYFTTPLRVGYELKLVNGNNAMSRTDLSEAVGSHRILSGGPAHRDRVAQELFELTDDRGLERYRAYLDMMHKLRAPDVGVRVDNGDLTRMLSESLPPLPDEVLRDAGQQLDSLTEARELQRRQNDAAVNAAAALGTYSGYVSTVIREETSNLAVTADTATAARGKAARAREEEDRTFRENNDGKALASRLGTEWTTLEASKRGLEQSQRFKDAQASIERSRTVDALEGAADTALGGWTAARGDATRAAGQAADAAKWVLERTAAATVSVTAAAEAALTAGIPHELPTLTVNVEDPGPETVTVRVQSSSPETVETVTRPPVLRVAPADLEQAGQRISQLRDAATERRLVAEARMMVSEQLDGDLRKVEAAEQEAVSAARAVEAAAEAVRVSEGAVAVEETKLTDAWSDWAEEVTGGGLLGPVSWDDTLIGDIVAGQPGSVPELDLLDRVADSLIQQPLVEIKVRRAELTAKLTETDTEHEKLRDEKTRLIGNQDQPPVSPDWVTVTDGTPFWKAVDFQLGVSAEEQAAVETALRTSGILTGTVNDAGVTAASGQLTVSVSGPAAAHPLTAVLTAEPGTVTADAVTAILERVSFNNPGHPVYVNDDGSWGVGILSGRPSSIDAPSHIGAVARGRARQIRITQIDARIVELDGIRDGIETERATLITGEATLKSLTASAPRSGALRTARANHNANLALSDHALTFRMEKDTAAGQLRKTWDGRFETHRRMCVMASMPFQTKELRETVEKTRNTADRCTAAITAWDAVRSAVTRYTGNVNASAAADTRTVSARENAETLWTRWNIENTELVKFRAAVGATVEEVMAEIRTLEQDLHAAEKGKKKAEQDLPELAASWATAVTTADLTSDTADAAEQALADAVTRLAGILTLPGVAAAASGADADLPGTLTAEALTGWVLERIPERKPVSVDAMYSTVQELNNQVSPTFEVTIHTVNNIMIVEMADANVSQPLADAVTSLQTLAEQGREALLESEHDLFSQYVIGGVADQLRLAIRLADTTIDDTNDRVSGYRTSNGIGVKLKFSETDTAGPELARIRDLVGIPDPLRTVEQTVELTRLIRQMVEDRYLSNPAAGYITALTEALDYTKWYTVEAIVLGPAEGQTRTLRNARLSAGELRYVSYAALICALDAHLSALPASSPRLLLLDDAFAMVDDNGRRNLVKILVNRDIDFIMTGFDLWLMFPEITSLDAYDVVATGEVATTVHYHWDGHGIHVRPGR